jgi:hypothetical protein
MIIELWLGNVLEIICTRVIDGRTILRRIAEKQSGICGLGSPFTITTINLLMMIKKVIAVYSENHTKPINTKCSITDCQSRWFIYLPLVL